jgi:hypothetical protein
LTRENQRERNPDEKKKERILKENNRETDRE